jgi:hypothetical protein
MTTIIMSWVNNKSKLKSSNDNPKDEIVGSDDNDNMMEVDTTGITSSSTSTSSCSNTINTIANNETDGGDADNSFLDIELQDAEIQPQPVDSRQQPQQEGQQSRKNRKHRRYQRRRDSLEMERRNTNNYNKNTSLYDRHRNEQQIVIHGTNSWSVWTYPCQGPTLSSRRILPVDRTTTDDIDVDESANTQNQAFDVQDDRKKIMLLTALPWDKNRKPPQLLNNQFSNDQWKDFVEKIESHRGYTWRMFHLVWWTVYSLILIATFFNNTLQPYNIDFRLYAGTLLAAVVAGATIINMITFKYITTRRLVTYCQEKFFVAGQQSNYKLDVSWENCQQSAVLTIQY